MIKILTRSLRLRLTGGFIVLALVAWGCACLAAWHETRHSLDKLFDTQQMLLAKRLSVLDPGEMRPAQTLPESKKLVRHHHGRLDDDVLAFAIFSRDGKRLLNDGDNGTELNYDYRQDGFQDTHVDGDEWRVLWLTTEDGKRRIAVGQEKEYREDLALEIVMSQLTPWLVALPVMMLFLVWLVSRELSPLRRIARLLHQRKPDATTPLPVDGTPQEVRPMVDELNQLFTRIHEFMSRERRFTSDAAHELRSPLAALKVQTEVAQLSQDDPASLDHALSNLRQGIDRASRLVEQLLTLSRLDSLNGLEEPAPIPMADLLQSAIMEAWSGAQRAGIDVRLETHAENVTFCGHQLLLQLLVRNLLENAIRYCPPGSQVDVVLSARGFSVQDNGPGVSAEALARIGERFYRPPGQEETGSGLGLSIVRRIAALHQMKVHFRQLTPTGFAADISW